MIDKARNLLILLTRSLIPPNMALEIFQGSRAYTTIEIGDQENGLCTTFGIKKKEYCIRWECLSCSIEALSKARRCHLFLNENTLTAVTAGKNSTLDGLRDDVKKCITTNLCLVDKFVDNVDFESLNCIGDSKDPHYKHYKVPSGYILECDDDIMPVVCCLYAPICENLVTKLKEALPMLTSMLTGYGASCTLAKDCMTLSSIERPQDPDIIDKEWQVLELLSTTHVPVSMASEIMSGNLQSGVFKIGNQEGGLCSLYGINKEDYLKQWNCLRYSLEALADEAVCNIFLNENTVAAVGGSSAIGIVQAFIDDCFLNNACPATAARNYKILAQGLDSIEDPHVKHMEMENPGSLSDMPKVTSYCMAFDIEQASEVSKHWEALKMFFNKYNISCQLFFEAAQYMYIIMSTTRRSGDPDFNDRTWDFLKLLLNNVPVLKAIEVLKSSQHCDFFEAGSAYGHFCSKFGITEEQFGKRVFPRISQGLKAFSSCHHHISANNIAIYGSTWGQICRLRNFVLHCYTYEAFSRSLYS